MQRWHRGLVTLAALAAFQPALAGPPPQYLEPRPACLLTESDAIPVQLERAESRIEQRYGLMERRSLPENHGMLFLYPGQRSANAGFWMYRTLIPLDIAWLDENGTVLAMDTMTPCESETAGDCPSWSPGVRHRHVLEMNAGFFARHRVDIGDRLVLNPGTNSHCATTQ